MKNEEQKPKQAAALSYQPDQEDAPRVVAKGRGAVAENILQKALDHGIPIQEDPSLVELLGKLDINQNIPEELYRVVAEIFAFIYKVDRNLS